MERLEWKKSEKTPNQPFLKWISDISKWGPQKNDPNKKLFFIFFLEVFPGKLPQSNPSVTAFCESTYIIMRANIDLRMKFFLFSLREKKKLSFFFFEKKIARYSVVPEIFTWMKVEVFETDQSVVWWIFQILGRNMQRQVQEGTPCTFHLQNAFFFGWSTKYLLPYLIYEPTFFFFKH